MELSKDKKFLYFIPRNGILTCIDLTSEETMKKDLFTAKDNADILKFVPSAKDPNVIYGMLREYICVIEKGVRKEKSKLAGGIELFCLSEITYHEGKNNRNLTIAGAQQNQFLLLVD